VAFCTDLFENFLHLTVDGGTGKCAIAGGMAPAPPLVLGVIIIISPSDASKTMSRLNDVASFLPVNPIENVYSCNSCPPC
jgi:hypothetical protein